VGFNAVLFVSLFFLIVSNLVLEKYHSPKKYDRGAPYIDITQRMLKTNLSTFTQSVHVLNKKGVWPPLAVRDFKGHKIEEVFNSKIQAHTKVQEGQCWMPAVVFCASFKATKPSYRKFMINLEFSQIRDMLELQGYQLARVRENYNVDFFRRTSGAYIIKVLLCDDIYPPETYVR
jgi:hypothetical protein